MGRCEGVGEESVYAEMSSVAVTELTKWRNRDSLRETTVKMSGLQQQLLLVDQLRREAAIKRINVGQAVEDLKKYVSQNEQEDYLLMGFSSQKSNPFREKSSCNLL